MEELNSPEKLLDFMSSNIKYGYVDKNNHKHNSLSGMYRHYILQTPQQVFENKIGVCWDQALFEAYIFDKYIKYPYKLFYIEQSDPMSSTHTFLIYNKMGKFYYFENSYEKLRGIHKLKDIDEGIDMVVKAMREDGKDSGVKVRMISKIPSGLDCLEFMNHCIYHGKKQTNPDGIYDYSARFSDIKEIVVSLSDKEKKYITDNDFIDSRYSIYRQVYLNDTNEPMCFLELYSFKDKSHAWITLATKPKFRKCGLAKIMVNDVINASYNIKGLKKLLWGAHLDNEISNKLAISAGFKLVESNENDNQYEYILKRD